MPARGIENVIERSDGVVETKEYYHAESEADQHREKIQAVSFRTKHRQQEQERGTEQ
jgi:hypothetical protein